MNSYLKIERSENGFGGPLFIEIGTNQVVLSVCGGGIHPLAKMIADRLHVAVIDGFKEKVNNEDIAVVVVDCAGTARCGVYPQMGIKTVNVLPVEPSGPLAGWMKEDLYVSGVTELGLHVVEGKDKATTTVTYEQQKSEQTQTMNKHFFQSISFFISCFHQSGRESLELILKNIVPFMIFISLMLGIVNGTQAGVWISEKISPLVISLPGMLLMSFIASLPFVSPIIAPGAVLASTTSAIVASSFLNKTMPVHMALPALFAINAQVGSDFIPVALGMMDANEKTVKSGIPAVLFSRMITGPLAVFIAYLFSLIIKL